VIASRMIAWCSPIDQDDIHSVTKSIDDLHFQDCALQNIHKHQRLLRESKEGWGWEGRTYCESLLCEGDQHSQEIWDAFSSMGRGWYE
jgi:hypothetical protein